MSGFGIFAYAARMHRIETKLDAALSQLGIVVSSEKLILKQEGSIMANIEDIEADEAAIKSAATDLINLNGEILAQLQALSNNPSIPPDVQAKIDDLHGKFHDDLAAITAELTKDGTAINPTPPEQLPVPNVTGVDPSTGNPGDTVTISGSAFTGVEAVDFGGAPVAATDFSAVDDKTITAKVPAGGSGKVTVTTAQGTSNAAAFTYGSAPAPGS